MAPPLRVNPDRSGKKPAIGPQPSSEEPGDDPGSRIEDDLGNAELIASAGMQNAVAVAGLGVLAMIPVAWALTRLRSLFRRSG